MDWLWPLDLLRIWIDGGTWADIRASHSFQMLLATACWVVPSSIIGLGIGLSEWRETPLALTLGFSPRDPDSDWAERARDLDKDGLPDF